MLSSFVASVVRMAPLFPVQSLFFPFRRRTSFLSCYVLLPGYQFPFRLLAKLLGQESKKLRGIGPLGGVEMPPAPQHSPDGLRTGVGNLRTQPVNYSL